MKFVDTGSRSSFIHPFPVRHSYDPQRMRALVEQHWMLNRSAVNEDTSKLCSYLADILDGDIFNAQAGETCLTWQMPLHWRVRKGTLKRKNGEVIVDYKDNPLHLWTHSIAFSGEISRQELLANHIASDPDRPDEFLYHYHNGYRYNPPREWGFSIPYRLVESMKDDTYQVDIDADLDEDGKLDVVDASLPGEVEDTILIMAHTCHPGLVSDGIGCIAIACELFHWLKARKSRKYTYRFIFGPEYFGGATYLDKAPEERIKSLKFGMYLDMLTTHEPLGFQTSAQGDSLLDRVTRNVLKSHIPSSFERTYRKLWGNDETLYNGPGFEIPTLGLGRAMHREYHYDTDNLENYSDYTALESLWVLSRIVEVFETDYVPVRKYKGPLYRSRFNIDTSAFNYLEDYNTVDNVQLLMDGKRSWFDIADELDVDAFIVKDFFDQLSDNSLIERTRRDLHDEDAGTLKDLR